MHSQPPKFEAKVCRTQRRQIETGVDFMTMGTISAKYASHWVDTSFTEDAIGTVNRPRRDGNDRAKALTTSRYSERYAKPSVFFEEIQSEERPPDLVLVDSGNLYRRRLQSLRRAMPAGCFPVEGLAGEQIQDAGRTGDDQQTSRYPYLETYAVLSVRQRHGFTT